jgi:uncharacterized protein (DUF427 family)
MPTDARAMWAYRGQRRPPFAVEPGVGEESVWDYPRPPRLAPDVRHIEVRIGAVTLASSTRAYRVLETASPPTFYLPPMDVDMSHLAAAPGTSVCEWKGAARYWALRAAPDLGAVGWSYVSPKTEFAAIANYLSFYPARLACFVAGERVQAQPGGFYGGWVTRAIVGPFKGEPGTSHW